MSVIDIDQLRVLLNQLGISGSASFVEFQGLSTNPGIDPDYTLYVDDGTNYNVGSLVWPGESVFLENLAIGDPGDEQSGINVGGTTYDALVKINDFSSTLNAELILHKHSALYAPIMVSARVNSDTHEHAAVTNGQQLFQLLGVGNTGTFYNQAARLEITVADTGTVSSTSLPGEIRLYTSPDGTSSPVLGFKLNSDGNIDLPKNTRKCLQIDNDSLSYGTSSLVILTKSNYSSSILLSTDICTAVGITFSTTTGTFTVTGNGTFKLDAKILLESASSDTHTVHVEVDSVEVYAISEYCSSTDDPTPIIINIMLDVTDGQKIRFKVESTTSSKIIKAGTTINILKVA